MEDTSAMLPSVAAWAAQPARANQAPQLSNAQEADLPHALRQPGEPNTVRWCLRVAPLLRDVFDRLLCRLRTHLGNRPLNGNGTTIPSGYLYIPVFTRRQLWAGLSGTCAVSPSVASALHP